MGVSLRGVPHGQPHLVRSSSENGWQHHGVRSFVPMTAAAHHGRSISQSTDDLLRGGIRMGVNSGWNVELPQLPSPARLERQWSGLAVNVFPPSEALAHRTPQQHLHGRRAIAPPIPRPPNLQTIRSTGLTPSLNRSISAGSLSRSTLLPTCSRPSSRLPWALPKHTASISSSGEHGAAPDAGAAARDAAIGLLERGVGKCYTVSPPWPGIGPGVKTLGGCLG